MDQLKLFIELTRLKKPIGYMLLFWPCIWGLTIVYDFNSSLSKYFFYACLFLGGSILMRSAGCIVNDIVDKNFDKKVERTKDRPIASGKVSVKLASFYTLALCSLAFLILINFNNLTILMALASMPLAFTYPLMKRVTYWPQLFLGITFNYGLILAWISITNQISIIPIIFYLGAIFWTLGYDTIYGFQDIKDDEIIGVKSTSIKFKKNPKKFLLICYLTFLISLILIGLLEDFKIYYFMFLIFPILQLLSFQIKNLDFKNTTDCLNKFKSNNFLGLLIFMNILIGKLI
ncbi:4-hydroxybenzoate octaprenyltransferase [Candidatus Pelagibacter sp.]|nr:4-hydroxybenzoate octaprenyltransferase [Candidatus Pelagibacter sp.]